MDEHGHLSPQATGAFDTIHHAHGYRWAPERHHWYWYAGIAAVILIGVIWVWLWGMCDSASGPVCSLESLHIAQAPGEAAELELADVSCLGGASERKMFLRPLNTRLSLRHAVATFDPESRVKARWVSDTEIRLSQTGGKIWAYQPNWHDVHIRYQH